MQVVHDCTGNGWDPTNPASGDGWESQALWAYSDTALPAIADFARANPRDPLSLPRIFGRRFDQVFRCAGPH